MTDPEFTEVPEADALEQRLETTVDEEEGAAPVLAPEVPEADALEQSRTVPVDDDYNDRA